MQVEARRAGWVSFIGPPRGGKSVIEALRVASLIWDLAALPVLLVNRRGTVFIAVLAVQLLKVSVVLAPPHISAPVSCVPLFFVRFLPVRDPFPFPLAWLIPLPLESPFSSGLLSPLSTPVTAVAQYSVVQLEGTRAAASSNALLCVPEVIMGSRLRCAQTWWWQPARSLTRSLPAVRWKEERRTKTVRMNKSI